jgi:acyl-[acyl-carrier-protein]-phospholipid O-acyltransferase/long-chain-fatty-acid--[acyl-carrier-protein] ligase
MKTQTNPPQAAHPPALDQNRSFWAFLTTQALGAFNDNVFKQLVLLLGVGYLILGVEYQALVQFLFALPFLLFSGLAGDLADKFSKGKLMIACKIAEVVIALMGTGAFLMMSTQHSTTGTPLYLWLLAGVTFFLGMQSAFFGPPKYGGLPELVRAEDLSQATGLTQMTTFLSIIFGVAVAGLLADWLIGKMYLAGLITVSIALAGTVSAFFIHRHPSADPKRRINHRSFISMLTTLVKIFRQDKLLFRIIVIYSWFWFVGGVTLTAINAFGRFQLGLNNFETSLMVATTSLGIAIGSVLIGKLSFGKIRLDLIKPALTALVFCLLLLAWLPVYHPGANDLALFQQLKNSAEFVQQSTLFPQASLWVRGIAFGLCFLLGISSGFYSVPLLAFIQTRPALADKGRVFAAVNWFNWVFILCSALFYGLGMNILQQQANYLFAALAGMTLLTGLVLIPAIHRKLQQEKPDFVHLR